MIQKNQMSKAIIIKNYHEKNTQLKEHNHDFHLLTTSVNAKYYYMYAPSLRCC